MSDGYGRGRLPWMGTSDVGIKAVTIIENIRKQKTEENQERFLVLRGSRPILIMEADLTVLDEKRRLRLQHDDPKRFGTNVGDIVFFRDGAVQVIGKVIAEEGRLYGFVDWVSAEIIAPPPILVRSEPDLTALQDLTLDCEMVPPTNESPKEQTDEKNPDADH